MTFVSIINGALGIFNEGSLIGIGGLGNTTSGDHQNYYSIEIGYNTEKSPGDLRRIAVS